MQSFSKLFINGQWLGSRSDATIEVINPATGEICACVPAANGEDVNLAVSAAKQAFPDWSATSAGQRREYILAIADEMQRRFDDLVIAISDTMGCPRELAKDIQVQGSIDAFRAFADYTDFVDAVSEENGIVQCRAAIGVCVLINPWNYPLSQLVGKLGPALATGCTVVVKPAEQTPLQDLIMAEIIEKVGLPNGVFNLITGYGHKIGEILCAHPLVDMVSFTGSTAAGIKVAEAAAGTVKRVCQELGGKSPYIITEDADLEAAVRYGVEDVMLNSGQTCCALTRMLVQKNLYQQAVALAKQVAEENVVGSPIAIDTSIGPLSSHLQQQRVRDYIQMGIDEGATLVTGGNEVPQELSQGAYVMPTIFADVSNDMRIAQEEIFGPVLCLIAYDDINDAIAIANDTPYGLSSAVYAKDATGAIKIARQIRAGQCYIQGSYFNTSAPFGGFKQSGNGREWGEEGLREFIEIQSIIAE
ncbi:aldehyde dehydrogenase family protein [Thalassotalea mangrovi]|uniref:Aldehyde dehydrogenase family protein n=1 Tax=Thalassotalea mangrovi TaxID=2572245 RepID=A0A4U1B526_9GAMM|nr:aldehyde dehydrogenase family protein [Thalassotalea mangrovi]TKB45376.1 aldehyde dehydrogenase family protein [Thalassotalea mangrovi]